MLKRSKSKSFGEDVHDLVLRVNMKSPNDTFLKFVTNDVAIKLNMFSLLMEDRIDCNMYCSLAITK